jgi:uncharacterized protein YkwD
VLRLRTPACGLLVCVLFACAIACAPASAKVHRAKAASAACTDATLAPSAATGPRIARATLCLLNAERRARGLGALRDDSRLDRAAAGHTTDMLRRRYFDHTSPAGSTLVSRLTSVRYISSSIAWSVGENLAWGSGSASTPRATVAGWMASAGHRANILNRDYRDIGFGVAAGTPRGGRGATYTTEFGRHG